MEPKNRAERYNELAKEAEMLRLEAEVVVLKRIVAAPRAEDLTPLAATLVALRPMEAR